MSGIRATLSTLIMALAVQGLPGSAPLVAQEEAQESAWEFKGELTSVLTQGNSDAITLGFGTAISRTWGDTELKFEGDWTRVETGTITRRAVGSGQSFVVERDVERERTSEKLQAKLRLDHDVSEHTFVYASSDWLRNTFSGIASESVSALGGGYRVTETDRTKLSTSFAGTYTFKDDVVPDPDAETQFAGLRVGYDLWREISGSAEYESDFTGDLNLKETRDRRFEMTHALTVDINDAIALKPSLEFHWRNLPALSEVPLFTSGGVDTGDLVEAPLQKLDTFFRLAVVVTF